MAQTPDQWPTMIPKMAALPVIVASPGVLTTAKIKDFGGLSGNDSPILKANAKMVDELIQRDCTITTQVARKADESRAYRYFSGDEAAITCTEHDGSTCRIVLAGNLVSEHGSLGLDKLESGTKAYFLAKQAGGI